MCPSEGKCIDHFLFFTLHIDGINCSGNLQGGDYYCLSLDLVNTNESFSTHDAMTFFSCVIQNRKEKGSRTRFLLFLDEYIRYFTLTSRMGIYVWYEGCWYHWRFAITPICADTVAYEELQEYANKKMTHFPCCFESSCKRYEFITTQHSGVCASEKALPTHHG